MSVLAVKFQTNGVNYKVVLHEISFHPVTTLSLIIQDNVRSVIMLPRFLQSVKVIIKTESWYLQILFIKSLPRIVIMSQTISLNK